MMKTHFITRFALSNPKVLTRTPVFVTLCLILLALLPTLWPTAFTALNPLRVDTDPENMLASDESARVFHQRMKRKLSLHDMIIVGIVDNKNPDGVFTVQTLNNIYQLTQFSKTLQWLVEDDAKKKVGVISADILAPSTLDNIETEGAGIVRFDWLMPGPLENQTQALALRDRMQRIPFLDGTLVSEDGKAICLYLPLSSKDVSYQVYSRLLEKIDSLKGDARYYISGLPVAEDAFGVEMFVQMGISAPLAMLVIFLLLSSVFPYSARPWD